MFERIVRLVVFARVEVREPREVARVEGAVGSAGSRGHQCRAVFFFIA